MGLPFHTPLNLMTNESSSNFEWAPKIRVPWNDHSKVKTLTLHSKVALLLYILYVLIDWFFIKFLNGQLNIIGFYRDIFWGRNYAWRIFRSAYEFHIMKYFTCHENNVHRNYRPLYFWSVSLRPSRLNQININAVNCTWKTKQQIQELPIAQS